MNAAGSPDFTIGKPAQLIRQDSTDMGDNRTWDEWEKTFDAIPDLIAIIDTNHRIIKANKAMANKLGCLTTEAVGCHCFEVAHGLEAVPDFCPHAKSLVSGNEEHSDLVHYRLGGSFDVTTTPIYDAEGKLTGSVHVARDITIRRKRENLMKENLALGEFALNHSIHDLLIYMIDKAEQFTGSQIGFFHFLAADETQISLQAWSTNTLKNFCSAEGNALHYPVDKAGVWVDCVRERRPLIHNDYANLPHQRGMPEGHATVVRELTIPIIRGDKVVAILGIGNKAEDYDESDVELVSQFANFSWEYIVSKRFEEALHQSEQYARALLDAIPDLIFRMSRDGTYLDYKAMKEDLFYQRDSIIGKNNRDLTPPDFADLVDSSIRMALDQNKMVMFEYQLSVPNSGMRDFEARMVPGAPNEVIAISRDITERKKTDESLKRKISEMELFNRMMIDRELKMIELKKEINILSKRLGEEDRYIIHNK